MKSAQKICILIILAVVVSPVSAIMELNQFAVIGDPAPGASDLPEFSRLFRPSINASGDLAFFALLRTGSAPGAIPVSADRNFAIFGPTLGAGSPTGIVAREGDQVLGATDLAEYTAPFFVLPRINSSGDMAFNASLRTGDAPGAIPVNSDLLDPDSNSTSIVGPTSGPGSALGIVVRENDPVPGAADLAEFSNFIATFPVLNAAGDVAFGTALRTGDSPGATPVTTENDTAVIGPTAGPGSSIGIVARSAAPAPGAADLAEFGSLFLVPALNDAGDVAFSADLITGSAPGATPVTFENNSAIFGPTAGAGSPLGIVARED